VRHRPRPEIYWREGGRGPALVLLNGWSASGLAWPRAWVRALEADFRVIRIDNRGTGYSRFAPTPFTMADMADDVAAVLDHVEVGVAVVLGMSMGGMIAQEVAFRHPDRLAGLVLVSTRAPAPVVAIPEAAGMMLDLLAPQRKGESLRTYMTRLWTSTTGPGFSERNPEAMAELVEQIVERPTPRALMMHQLRAVHGFGHAKRLCSITAPTAVVHGTDDAIVNVANGRVLAELIPSATYIELEGVGHLPPVEAPERLLEAIAEAGSALTVPSGANTRSSA
jgi:pimeloyl-ACP methyl ester carboxylesterase